MTQPQSDPNFSANADHRAATSGNGQRPSASTQGQPQQASIPMGMLPPQPPPTSQEAVGIPPNSPPPPPPPAAAGSSPPPPERPFKPQASNAFTDFLRGPMLEGRASNITIIRTPSWTYRSQRNSFSLIALVARHPRRARQVIRCLVWLLPAVFLTLLTEVAGNQSYSTWGAGWLLVGWFVSGSGWVIASFIHHVSCPLCRENLDLWGRWFCGCGYHDHREQHFYTFHCPLCRGRLGYFDCPRCQSTIIM